MKPIAILLTLLAASSALAASNDVAVVLLQPNLSGVAAQVQSENLPVSLASRVGVSASFAHHYGPWSFALDVSQLNAPVSAEFSPATATDVGTLRMRPVAASVALHGVRGRFSPYLGVGAAYVVTDNLKPSQDIGTVDVGNDLTYVIKAGTAIEVSPGVAVKLEGRYMPISMSTSAQGLGGTVDVKVLSLGAGIQWSF